MVRRLRVRKCRFEDLFYYLESELILKVMVFFK